MAESDGLRRRPLSIVPASLPRSRTETCSPRIDRRQCCAPTDSCLGRNWHEESRPITKAGPFSGIEAPIGRPSTTFSLAFIASGPPSRADWPAGLRLGTRRVGERLDSVVPSAGEGSGGSLPAGQEGDSNIVLCQNR